MNSPSTQFFLVFLSFVSLFGVPGGGQDKVQESPARTDTPDLRKVDKLSTDIALSDVRWSEFFPGHGVPVLNISVSALRLHDGEDLKAAMLSAFEDGGNWVAAHIALVALHNGLTSSRFDYSSFRQGADLVVNYDGLSVQIVRETDGEAFFEKAIYPEENEQRRHLLEMWKERLSGVDLTQSKPVTFRKSAIDAIRDAFQDYSTMKSLSVESHDKEALLASFKFVHAEWGQMQPTSELLSFPVAGCPDELKQILIAFAIIETSDIDDEVARAHMILTSALEPNSVYTNGSTRNERGLECVSVYVDRISVAVDTKTNSWSMDFETAPLEEIRHYWKCVSQYVLRKR